jgi:hypothetical protein
MTGPFCDWQLDRHDQGTFLCLSLRSRRMGAPRRTAPMWWLGGNFFFMFVSVE